MPRCCYRCSTSCMGGSGGVVHLSLYSYEGSYFCSFLIFFSWIVTVLHVVEFGLITYCFVTTCYFISNYFQSSLHVCYSSIPWQPCVRILSHWHFIELQPNLHWHHVTATADCRTIGTNDFCGVRFWDFCKTCQTANLINTSGNLGSKLASAEQINK